jgi:hypothetical protein
VHTLLEAFLNISLRFFVCVRACVRACKATLVILTSVLKCHYQDFQIIRQQNKRSFAVYSQVFCDTIIYLLIYFHTLFAPFITTGRSYQIPSH